MSPVRSTSTHQHHQAGNITYSWAATPTTRIPGDEPGPSVNGYPLTPQLHHDKQKPGAVTQPVTTPGPTLPLLDDNHFVEINSA